MVRFRVSKSRPAALKAMALAVVALVGVTALLRIEDPEIADLPPVATRSPEPTPSQSSTRGTSSRQPTERPAPPKKLEAVNAAPASRSFANAPDMYSFAASAIRSSSSSDVFEGFMALRECLGIEWQLDNLGLVQSNVSSELPGANSPERQVAVAALVARCASAHRVGGERLKDTMRATNDHMLERDSIEFRRLLPPSDFEIYEEGNLARLMSSASASAVRLGIRHLAPLWAERLGIGADADRVALLSLSAELAVCRIAADCGPNAFRSQVLCAFGGECAVDYSGWLERQAQSDPAFVQQHAEGFTRALKERRFDEIGISSRASR